MRFYYNIDARSDEIYIKTGFLVEIVLMGNYNRIGMRQ